tara:strand:- start:99 stop:218 length:120 start_codon:yes stop_codon:yes gene_type:complete
MKNINFNFKFFYFIFFFFLSVFKNLHSEVALDTARERIK